MENELYHYGVLGMKWGIRRYQNADGTLTAAGKKHYGEGTHVGSKQRLKRAFDAREIDDRLDSITGRRATEKRNAKVDHLSKMREGLMKDLDEKEIRYADLYIQRQYIRREINRIQAFTTVGENALSGIAARKLARAVRSEKQYNREIYRLDREFRKNRKEAKAQAKANKDK